MGHRRAGAPGTRPALTVGIHEFLNQQVDAPLTPALDNEPIVDFDNGDGTTRGVRWSDMDDRQREAVARFSENEAHKRWWEAQGRAQRAR